MSSNIGRRLRVVREAPERESLAPGQPPWPSIPVGTIVHEYKGYTWGCLDDSEIAVTGPVGAELFRGVPRDSVEDAPEDPFTVEIRERAKQSALRMIGETRTGHLRAAAEGARP